MQKGGAYLKSIRSAFIMRDININSENRPQGQAAHW